VTVLVSTIDGLGVRIPRSGFRQTAADEVGPGDNGDIEPCLAGDELIGAVGVSALDDGGADENRYNDPHHCPKLGGLEGLLGLGRQPANATSASDLIGPHVVGAQVTALGCGFHSESPNSWSSGPGRAR